jgi:hypothetical protein
MIFYSKNALAYYYNAGIVAVNLKVVPLDSVKSLKFHTNSTYIHIYIYLR